MGSSLNLSSLINNKSEILKAEIAALFCLLKKTSSSFWIKNHQSNFNFDAEMEIIGLKTLPVQLWKQDNGTIQSSTIDIIEIIKNFRNSNNNELIKVIFARGCENINSGLDKGCPKAQLQDSLWLANAFGSFEREIKPEDLDNKRQVVFAEINEQCQNKGLIDKAKLDDPGCFGFKRDYLSKHSALVQPYFKRQPFSH